MVEFTNWRRKKTKNKPKQRKLPITIVYIHTLLSLLLLTLTTVWYYIIYWLIFLCLSITLQYKVFEGRKFVYSWLALHACKIFLVHNKSSINIFQVIINKDKFTERKMARRIVDMCGLHRVLMKGKNSWWKWSQS